MTMRSRFNHAKWRLRHRLARYRRAWRYAINRMSEDDADEMRYDCQLVAGFYPLSALTYEDALRECEERFGPSPELSAAVRIACERVHSKWPDYGENSDAARDWVMDLVLEQERRGDLTLADSWDDEAEEREDA